MRCLYVPAKPALPLRFSVNRVVVSKPRDPSKNAPLPRKEGFKTKSFKRSHGSIMNDVTREKFVTKQAAREAFFAGLKDV